MPSKYDLQPFNFQKWLDDNRDKFKPPVGNAQIWEDGELMVTVVGGPNFRTDFHDDPVEEFFYQMTGDMVLRIQEHEGEPHRDIRIREGDIFFLPPHVRHSPQRPLEGSLGLVVEPKRPEGDKDAFEWYCLNCHYKVHRVEVQLESIVRDLPPLFNQFDDSIEHRTCGHCGEVHPGKTPPDHWKVNLEQGAQRADG
ncbi:MAG: 3-hydroxyanthranilate 3,4-dioxygenase [Gammaproteobacteria bacterium]|nr:3-hydroxyanthranilate 3,4-dioxygenase [Gammaproteobacteria bacterium]